MRRVGETYSENKRANSCPDGLPPPLHAKSVNGSSRLISHIAEDDEDAASLFGSSLLDHVELFTRFPRMGGAIPRQYYFSWPEARISLRRSRNRVTLRNVLE